MTIITIFIPTFALIILLITIMYWWYADSCSLCCWQRRRARRNRSNQISPYMFDVLARIIEERNIITRLEQEHAREIELTEVRNKYKHTVIIINPDEEIQLGTI